MSQIPGMPPSSLRSKPGLDVYSAMLIIATAFVLIALIVLMMGSGQLLGNVLPMAGD